MKRLVLTTLALATAVGLAAPAGAEPQQTATGSGVLTVTLTTSGDTYTWGPWKYVGTWRTDDGASFAGTLTGDPVTTSPPVPTWVIQDFAVDGANATGSITGTCNGSVDQQLPALLELSTNCILTVAGASLRAEESDTVMLAAVHHTSTPSGVVTVYRGTFSDIASAPGI